MDGAFCRHSHNSITGITGITVHLSLVVCLMYNRSNPLVHNAYVCMDLGCGIPWNFLAAPGCVGNPKVKNLSSLCRFGGSWCIGNFGWHIHNRSNSAFGYWELPSRFAMQHAPLQVTTTAPPSIGINPRPSIMLSGCT